MPQPHNETSIRQWLSTQSPPVLVLAAEDFIDNPNRQFVALTLFPLLPAPGHSVLRQDEVLMMYLLEYQQGYWPSVMSFSAGARFIGDLRSELQFKVQDEISRICEEPVF